MSTHLDTASLVLSAQYGEPVRTQLVLCRTEQWNFPHDPEQPWVDRDGVCSICGQQVEFVVLGPDKPSQYTRIAEKHTRTKRWYAIDGDELHELLEYEKHW